MQQRYAIVQPARQKHLSMAKRAIKSLAENDWIHIKDHRKSVPLVSVRIFFQLPIQKVSIGLAQWRIGKNSFEKIFVPNWKVIWIYSDHKEIAQYTYWSVWQEIFLPDRFLLFWKQNDVLHS